MAKLDEMTGAALWIEAQKALRENRLRDAKAALDEMGLRFDDAYARLEAEMLKGKETVWS